MKRLLARLEELEAANDSTPAVLCIFVPDGQRLEDCIKRAGHDPSKPRPVFIAAGKVDLSL